MRADVSTPEKQLSTMQILHVDDELDLVELTATFLQHENEQFRVSTATSASEGRDILAAHAIDCIVSDYDMPHENGLEFLATVRENHPDLPFILFTGKGSEEVASEAISAGVTDYLQKGAGTDQYALLANRIQNAINGRHAEQIVQRQLMAIETAQEGISILDKDSVYVYVNQKYADLYGYEAREMLGEHCELVYPEGDTAFVRDEILATVADEGYWHGESTGLRADGTTFPGDHAVSLAAQGYLVCTVRDMSSQRMRESELYLKTRAMDKASVGISISDPSRDDNPLIYVNEHFEWLTGYDAEEVIGRNCRFLQGADTNPETVSLMREAIDAAEPITVELRNYRKDGTEFWNRVTITPIRDEDDAVTNYLGFQEDITERKRHEQQFKAVLEASPDAVIVVNSDGVITQANHHVSDVLGYSPEELTGKPVEELLVDDDREKHIELRQEYMMAPERRPMARGLDLYALRKDDTSVPVEISLGPVERDGEVYVVATISDVS